MQLAPLLSTFVLILLAELPDKTLYTVLLLATRNRALPVLAGACAAFLLHGFIALGLGVLAAHLPHALVAWGTAALFLSFGLFLFLHQGEEEPGAPATDGRTLLASFGLVFAAEWGDATQIGTAALVAGAPEHRWQVLIGATVALWLGAGLAVWIGRTARHRIPQAALRKLAGAAFCGFALFSAWHAL